MIVYNNNLSSVFPFWVPVDKLIADQFAECYIAFLGENGKADVDPESLSDIDDVEVLLSMRSF